MDLSAGEVSRIFRTYQTQSRIAEFNKKESIKTVQSQVDQVTISPEARQLLSMSDTAESKADVVKITNLEDIPLNNPETAEE